MWIMVFLPAECYTQQTGMDVTLEKGEALVYDEQGMAVPEQVEIHFKTAENPNGDITKFQVQGQLQQRQSSEPVRSALLTPIAWW